MEKTIIAVLALFFAAGTAFAQTPADSTQAKEKLEVRPHLKFKHKLDSPAFRFGLPRQNAPDILKKLGEAKAMAKEDVTPFYSNMPMARYPDRGKDIPNVKADESTMRYHLLQKRYKVLPLPTEPEIPFGGGDQAKRSQ